MPNMVKKPGNRTRWILGPFVLLLLMLFHQVSGQQYLGIRGHARREEVVHNGLLKGRLMSSTMRPTGNLLNPLPGLRTKSPTVTGCDNNIFGSSCLENETCRKHGLWHTCDCIPPNYVIDGVCKKDPYCSANPCPDNGLTCVDGQCICEAPRIMMGDFCRERADNVE
jgi:hypothetical protein